MTDPELQDTHDEIVSLTLTKQRMYRERQRRIIGAEIVIFEGYERFRDRIAAIDHRLGELWHKKRCLLAMRTTSYEEWWTEPPLRVSPALSEALSTRIRLMVG